MSGHGIRRRVRGDALFREICVHRLGERAARSGPALAGSGFVTEAGPMNVETVARRILSEFEEMPGLALTVRQAARLFGVEPGLCQVAIDALVDRAYLRETRRGIVVRGDRVAA